MANWIYFGLLGGLIALWLAYLTVYLDSKYRQWKWDRRRGKRGGWLTAHEFFAIDEDVSSSGRAERSE